MKNFITTSAFSRADIILIVRTLLESYSAENRLNLIDDIMHGYCRLCGRIKEPLEQCHCANDE